MKLFPALAALSLAFPVAARAADSVTSCDHLPISDQIEVFSPRDTMAVCREMLRVMEGVSVDDLITMQKAVYVMSHDGYHDGDYALIARKLVDIIRLRGEYASPATWKGTLDIAYRSWEAFNGLVSPDDIAQLLHDLGPMAKTINDDGLISMVVMIEMRKKHGDDD